MIAGSRWATSVLVAIACEAAPAAELAGTVQLLSDGQAVSTGEVREAVVFWEPARAVVVQPASRPVDMVMQQKAFVPHVAAVTRGSTVRFPNADPILHNVFSVSPENPFDLGLYGSGPGKTVTFETPGLVRVYCNVHHAMVAYVLVLDTPFFVSPESDGGFALASLPTGEGRLHVWHERTEPWNRRMTLPTDEPVVVRLEITQRRVAPHFDKSGKPYRETRGDKSYR
jgi:plastocyanin